MAEMFFCSAIIMIWYLPIAVRFHIAKAHSQIHDRYHCFELFLKFLKNKTGAGFRDFYQYKG